VFISGEEKVVITFESRFLLGKLPSKLTFAYAVLNQMRLSSLTNGIVCINKRVIDVPNKMVISQHDCVYEQCTSDLNIPKRVANCKLVIKSCKAHPYRKSYFGTLYLTKKSLRLRGDPQCHGALCIKKGPASLKSLGVIN